LADATIVSCPHADRCPGCALIRLAYPAQLAIKRQALERAIRRHPALERVAVEDAIGADRISGYRVRAKLAVAPAQARIGAYAGPSHEVVDTPDCRVLSPPIAASVAALRSLLASPPAEIAPLLSALTAVDLRAARGPEAVRVLLTLILDRERAGTDAEQALLAERVLAACPPLSGVAVSIGSLHGPQQLGSAPRALAGRHELVDLGDGAELLALPGAFAQVHREQADRIAREIAIGLSDVLGALAGARVLDLYAGSGALGLSLAGRGARVTLVESYPPAADAARRAGARFGDRVQVVAEDAARFLASQPATFQAVIVNPPRRGIAPAARGRLAAAGARVVVYVSCNPATLARDLAHLALLGLTARRAIPIDMMPLTEEVETLALLEPGPPPPVRVIAEDDELLVVDKPAHDPTLERVRALAGCGAVTQLFGLGRSTSGVCVFAKTARAAARWSRSAASWRVRWVLLARGRAKQRSSSPAPPQRRLELVAGHSLLEVEAAIGEQRLTRRLAELGRPVIGDARNGHSATNRHFGERYGLDRAFLHCAAVEIERPKESARVLEAPLAGDLRAVLEAAAGRMPSRGVQIPDPP
jgi:23S rRNA (uracil1939-C5)-methyltransferase